MINFTDYLSFHELDSGDTVDQLNQTMLSISIGIEFGWSVIAVHTHGSTNPDSCVTTCYVMGNKNAGLVFPDIKLGAYVAEGIKGLLGVYEPINEFMDAWRNFVATGTRYNSDEYDLLAKYIILKLIPFNVSIAKPTPIVDEAPSSASPHHNERNTNYVQRFEQEMVDYQGVKDTIKENDEVKRRTLLTDKWIEPDLSQKTTDEE